jgi:hypothetical protein
VEEEMKKLFVIALVLIAVPAFAQQTLNYSWEDGGTILGFYGSNLVDASNVSGPQTGSQGSLLPDYTCPGAVDGTYYLHVAEDPHTGTPQAFVCWVDGLLEGDIVDAMFYGYDITPGASPSLRIWGSYTATGGDVNSYHGSAGGADPYTAGTGWDLVSHTWTFFADGGAHGGLVIQARLYSDPATSDPDRTDYWIDDITVTAPPYATIHFPEPVSPVEESSWTNIKALFR